MIIQHNIMALNSHRQLGTNNTTLSKNLEKLSSGYRINKAADDAAGLAISEKMRAQITGLDRASLNAKDGSSLIQTAEGALQEVHGMLNRMVELATQSANGTIQSDDRQKIESELSALKEEVDRISKATNFNGINLLDGSLGKGSVEPGAGTWAPGQAFNGGGMEAVLGQVSGMSVGAGDSFAKVANVEGQGGFEAGMADSDYITFQITKANGDIENHALKIADIVSFTNPDGSTVTNPSDFASIEKGAKGTIDLSSIGLGKAEITVTKKPAAAGDLKAALETLTGTAKEGTAASGKGLTMQVGDTAQDFNKITVSVDDMSSVGLGIKGISMENQASASQALDKIKAAIEKVSVNRGNLGALQNRLEHTINNLGVTTENMTAAESRIRDVDMAKEMMQFTKNNVLTQAAQSMLAQANQQPQQILQLLR